MGRFEIRELSMPVRRERMQRLISSGVRWLTWVSVFRKPLNMNVLEREKLGNRSQWLFEGIVDPSSSFKCMWGSEEGMRVRC